MCASLPTIAKFYRHCNIIDQILPDKEHYEALVNYHTSRFAKARSISLATPLNPTHTAAYLSMIMDQLIWSPRSIEDDEKDMVRLNALDVMRDAMKSAKRFISQAQ